MKNFADFIDLLIKTGIAAILGLSGWLFKQLHSDVQNHSLKIAIHEVRDNAQDLSIDKIDKKLDVILMELRKR